MSRDEKRRRPRQVPPARVAPGPLHALKRLLYRLYVEAGTPAFDDIADQIGKDDRLPGAPSGDTVRRCVISRELPANYQDAVAVAVVLARLATWDPNTTARQIRELWTQERLHPTPSLRAISDWEPDKLGVHRAIRVGDDTSGLARVTDYVERDHDRQLRARLHTAAAGESVLAVLVGGSCTGKTRAMLEAVTACLADWPLLAPRNAQQFQDWVDADSIDAGTVLWLNETQRFLPAAADRLAVLLDRVRPLAVIGSMWPDYYHPLTALPGAARSPDPAVEAARDLLEQHQPKIVMVERFDGDSLTRIQKLADRDLRLAAALAPGDGRVTQHLTGGPELVAHYDNPGNGFFTDLERAVITAALDARRLGHTSPIPAALLADAAAYLSGPRRVSNDPRWIDTVLHSLTDDKDGKRVHGALTALTPDRLDDGIGPADGYHPADYLDQHTRRTRSHRIPPAQFWAATARHTRTPTDLNTLGDNAWNHGLYRDATQLHKHATTHGDRHAADALITHLLHTLHQGDHRPATHAAIHITVTDPVAVVWLLDSLHEVGAVEQLDRLLGRDPASHVSLNDPVAVAWLLGSLRLVGAVEQLDRLLGRDPASHVSLNDPGYVVELLDRLHEVGRGEQLAILADRAAALATLSDLVAVAELLDRLHEVGAEEQLAILADRAARDVSLSDPGAVAWLLGSLHEVGAEEQLAILADRAARDVSLSDPGAVARLLDRLHKVGAEEQLDRLLGRDPASHVSLNDPVAVAWLLGSLRLVGAEEQLDRLLGRDPASHVSLNDPRAVAELLDRLHEVGAEEQLAILADRAARDVSLSDPGAVADLLDRLHEVGAEEQLATLADRADRAARDVSLSDPGAVARLLDRLHEVGAVEQLDRLLGRDPASHVSLDDPGAVADLLDRLHEVGAEEQLATLADRLPAAGHFDRFLAVGSNRERFRFGREPDGSAAGRWSWDDLE